MPRRISLAVLLLAVCSFAGGGPESTLVVVNGRSPLSRLVANEYRRLRSIPASHLLVLDRVPAQGVIPLARFREEIWQPIAAHLKDAGLEESIDQIAYSADFPYGVDFRKEYQRLAGGEPAQGVGGVASLTGATYLIRQIEADEEFWDIRRVTNRYFRIGATQPRPLTAEQRNLAVRAQRLHKERKYRDARAAYEEFLEAAPGYGRVWAVYAGCLAAMGETDAAFDALAKASARGFNQIGMIESDADFAALRATPRWPATLEAMRQALAGLRPTMGFRAATAWDSAGEPDTSDAAATSVHRYILATQIAYTGFLGNSVPEILAYLRAAAGADGTKPDGTVYICRNDNVRSTAREAFFGPLSSALRARGRKVELLDKTTIPSGKADVIGAVVGTAGFDWGKAQSRILPGAICEHLTSFGAHFGTAGQTKLTEFLRYGAAGASGTVMEPLAIHLKFPNPMIHAFYADGCNLAESFYQAVGAPYQLLIVGDGLCQPFAHAPEFELSVPKQPWKGKVAFAPEGDAAFEYWLDGKRVATGASYELDANGAWHEFSVVGVARDEIGAQRAWRFANSREPVAVAYGEPIPVKGTAALEVYYGTRRVGGDDVAKRGVPSTEVGPGPVRLRIRDADRESVLDVDVTLPDPAPARTGGVEPALGLLARLDDGDDGIASTLAPRPAGLTLREQIGAKPKAAKFTFTGAVRVPEDGAYQFLAATSGAVRIRIGQGEWQDRAVLRSLAAGWHEIEIEYERRGDVDLEMLVAGARPAFAPEFARVLPDLAAPEVETAKDGSFEFDFKRRPKRDIAALGVVPAEGAAIPSVWTVETKRSKSGRWKAVEGVRVRLAPSATRPAKGEKPAPAAVEIVFPPQRSRYLRLAPAAPVAARSVVVTRVAE